MDAKIVGTHLVLNIVEVITHDNIMISDTPYFVIILVGPSDRVCNSFEGCLVPLYECLFTRLRIHLLFSDFEVDMMNHLKVPPSQLHPRDWAFMLMFQLCAECKSWKPSFGLFFGLFYVARTSLDDARDKDWPPFVPKYIGSTHLLMIGELYRVFHMGETHHF